MIREIRCVAKLPKSEAIRLGFEFGTGLFTTRPTIQSRLWCSASACRVLLYNAGTISRKGYKLPQYHVAQVNIGRILAPLDDPQMAGFVGRLDELNALADCAPGFVWRLQTSEGNATYFRPYNDDRVLMNM